MGGLQHLKFILLLTLTLLIFSCAELFALCWLIWDYFFVHMWGKRLRVYEFLHYLLTFLGVLSKAYINQVKWILYKEQGGVGWKDQLFINQISITALFRERQKDCTNFKWLYKSNQNQSSVKGMFWSEDFTKRFLFSSFGIFLTEKSTVAATLWLCISV